MNSFRVGDEVMFKPKKGRSLRAEVAFLPTETQIDIIIGNDPFPVNVPISQVSGCADNGKVVSSGNVRKVRTDTKGPGNKMATATKNKPSAKELRKQAQGLGVKGWEEMDRPTLRKAIKRAKKAQNGSDPEKTTKPKTKPVEAEEAPVAKSKTKKVTKAKPVSKPKTAAAKPKAAATKPKTKAAAKKAAPAKKAAKKAAPAKATKTVSNATSEFTFAKSHPKPTPAHGENPFRPNSNLFIVAKLLLKGGVRRSLAEKLMAKVDLHPYQKADGDVALLDYDKRLLLGAQTMRDEYGYGIQRVGRGMGGKILVFVPDGPTDPRKKVAKSKKKG